MKQKTIKTAKATLLVVELPNGKYVRCHKGYIIQSCSTELDLLNKCKRIDNGDTNGFIHIGNWQLLGRLPDITEEQAHSIVDKEFNEMTDEWFYRNHLQDEDYSYTVGESLSSLLQANELYFENSLGSKPTVMDYAPYCHIEGGNTTSRMNDDDWKQYETDLQEWHEAQSKVFDKERTYIFIKVE